MSETPFHDALEAIPKNEARLEGGVTSADGAELGLTLEREKQLQEGELAGGLQANVSQRKGWGVTGFIKWVWGK